MSNVTTAIKNRFNAIREDERTLWVVTPVVIVGTCLVAGITYDIVKAKKNESE
jgi:hypothetical protein